MNVKKLIILIVISLVFCGMVVTFALINGVVEPTDSTEITIEQDDRVGYRFTDISEKGFDCKTIMWSHDQMTCVDWDGVRD